MELEVPMMETMVDFTLVEHLYGFNFIPPKAIPNLSKDNLHLIEGRIRLRMVMFACSSIIVMSNG
jgi:hypothetical protein